MLTQTFKEPYDGYCGTSYAAKLLGISVGTVHNLVEKNDLIAWKTQGGHRRISLQSIQNYLYLHNIAPASLLKSADRIRVLVVEDDENTRQMLQANFNKWDDLPLDAVMYASAIEAILDISSLRPHVLLTDLRLPNMNGFEFLKVLSTHDLFSSLVIVVMTGMNAEDVQANGGLPDGVQILRKPVEMDWLRGFFNALLLVQKEGVRSFV